MAFTWMDLAAIALTVVCIIILRSSVTRSKPPLPPGPTRWPVVGNLFSLPESGNMFDAFTEWSNQYGDVTFAQILNQSIVIINSYEAALELLEHRSILYSQRPRMVMANELVGWEPCLATMPYGTNHRRMRKIIHEGTSPKAMETLRPAQEREALKFVQRLLDTPGDLHQHIRQTAGATLIKLVYGYEIETRHDYFLDLAEKAVDMFSVVTTPGSFMVDTFPWLKILPWAPFKTKAKEWQKLVTRLLEEPAGYTRQCMEKGKFEPCLLAGWLERAGEQGAEKDEMLIKWAATTIYSAGIDTTVSSVSFFFAHMVHHPDIQAAAQAEIDRVVGTQRLPTYSDRESLPYVEALFKEVLRWHPAAPFGIPHQLDSDQDDVYKGMRIPRGSLIIPNIRAMTRNPNVYHDPDGFTPERFLNDDGIAESDPGAFVFGFGRRRCPGIHIAHSSVWLSIALTLAVYDITPYVGADGTPELPTLGYSRTTISQPEPFKCTIKLRSMATKKLVEDSVIIN
ncbi:cytochrome P450 family protein [Ceratobasidium sp. AG-Ba]|nr:cytochrome P450 family protein [Ceratobasidium sp. AG-Ba]